jgi:hypothetical protein
MTKVRLALAVIGLASLVGCAQCGDAIICPPASPVDFPSNQVAKVRIQGDALIFELPRVLNRHPMYRLGKAYVYEAVGEKVVWQLVETPQKGLTKQQSSRTTRINRSSTDKLSREPFRQSHRRRCSRGWSTTCARSSSASRPMTSEPQSMSR